ncbi:MAG TPA: hypothetical protein VFV52_12445 [Bacilli bacterium]|nr:hypothetical protein [Bacilli bacterium]
MLNVLLIAAVAYLLYYWGIRLLMRGQLLGRASLELFGYLCSLAAGTTVSLSATLYAYDTITIWSDASTWELSLVSTVLSVLIGESIHGRSARLSLRLLAPLRKEGKPLREGER